MSYYHSRQHLLLLGSSLLALSLSLIASVCGAASTDDDDFSEIAESKTFDWSIAKRVHFRNQRSAEKKSSPEQQQKLQDMFNSLEEGFLDLVPVKARPAYKRARQQMQAGQLDKALKSFDEAIAAAPNNQFLYGAKSDALIDANRSEEALAVCDKELKVKPDSYYGLLKRAYCYFSLNKLPQGIADCTKAIAISPEAETAYVERAKAYKKMGDAKLAQLDEEKVRHLRLPEMAHNAFLHGNGQALSLVDEAIKDKPASAYLHVLKGDIVGAMGKSQDALSEYEVAIKDCPKAKPYLLPSRAGFYADLEQYDKALADMDAVVKAAEQAPPVTTKDWFANTTSLNQYLSGFLMERSVVLTRAKRYTQALDDASRVIKMNGLPEDYAQRASIYATMGDTTKALADYATACKLGPSSKILLARAALYTNMGKRDLAKKDEDAAKARAAVEAEERKKRRERMTALRAQWKQRHAHKDLGAPD